MDEFFFFFRIIKTEVSFVNGGQRLITLTESLIIPDFTKAESTQNFTEDKTPKVVSVGCVGLWKHNDVLSEFGKIRKPERCVMLSEHR